MDNFRETNWFKLISSHSDIKTYRRGDIFSTQGEAQKKIGLVVSGKATALSYSINGDETWVGEYKQGQFIGLVSLLTNELPNFEIRASSNLTLRVLSYDKMLKLFREDLALFEITAKDLATRLNTSIADLINIHTLSVKGRICSELLRLSLPIGINPDRHIIRPSPVFVELARRLNSTRETVSRTVSELQGRGILTREPGALIVEDPDKLQDAIEFI